MSGASRAAPPSIQNTESRAERRTNENERAEILQRQSRLSPEHDVGDAATKTTIKSAACARARASDSNSSSFRWRSSARISTATRLALVLFGDSLASLRGAPSPIALQDFSARCKNCRDLRSSSAARAAAATRAQNKESNKNNKKKHGWAHARVDERASENGANLQ